MRVRRLVSLAITLGLFLGASSLPARSDPPPPLAPPAQVAPDLADEAEGVYIGSVISDSHGASRAHTHVRLTVTKTGHNQISIASSYQRLPTFTADLTRAMNTIQKTYGPEVFLLDLSKSPRRLDVTVDGASWSGAKTAEIPVSAPPPLAGPPKPKPDLADVAQGVFFGSVISDARGAGRSDVRITVQKVGPNKIEVSSDYPRLPTFTARLTKALKTIQKTVGPQVFLLDLSKHPNRLDVTDDDASWSGSREGDEPN